MGIRHIEVAEVSCQNCDATILVRNWRDAAEHGWAVPSDGHLQMCPECIPKYKAGIFAEALQNDITTVLGPHSVERIHKAANAIMGNKQ